MIAETIKHNRCVAETGKNLSNLPDCSVAKGEGASKRGARSCGEVGNIDATWRRAKFMRESDRNREYVAVIDKLLIRVAPKPVCL